MSSTEARSAAEIARAVVFESLIDAGVEAVELLDVAVELLDVVDELLDVVVDDVGAEDVVAEVLDVVVEDVVTEVLDV